MTDRSWMICTEHDVVVTVGGFCPQCNGDRNLIQVRPVTLRDLAEIMAKSAAERSLAHFVQSSDATERARRWIDKHLASSCSCDAVHSHLMPGAEGALAELIRECQDTLFDRCENLRDAIDEVAVAVRQECARTAHKTSGDVALGHAVGGVDVLPFIIEALASIAPCPACKEALRRGDESCEKHVASGPPDGRST